MVDDGQDRLTCYDAVLAFREVLPTEGLRYPLEGGVILCSLFEISEKETPRLRARHNDIAKAAIASVAAKELNAFLGRCRPFASIEETVERDRSFSEFSARRIEEYAQAFSLRDLFMPPIQYPVGNLFAETLKLARYRKSPKAVFSELGTRVDCGIVQLYAANGLPPSVDRSPPDLFRARVIEYEFFARIVHDMYCRQRGGR